MEDLILGFERKSEMRKEERRNENKIKSKAWLAKMVRNGVVE